MYEFLYGLRSSQNNVSPLNLINELSHGSSLSISKLYTGLLKILKTDSRH